MSQGNKVIAVGAARDTSGRMLVPWGKTWDLMPFLLNKVKIMVWVPISKAAGVFQAWGASSDLGYRRQRLNPHDLHRTKHCRETFPNFFCLLLLLCDSQKDVSPQIVLATPTS